MIMTNRNKVMLGILGAAAAGVVIGMLIAPEKGKDMRKKIRKTAGDWADSLGTLWHRGKDGAEEMAEEVKEKVRHARAAAEEKVNKLKESYNS
jgi:gas vesicle protein